MRITVQARHPVHGQLARAGRFWPTAQPLEVEVLDTEEDPPPVMVKVKNPTTLVMEDKPRPNPTKIGRASYKLLMDDNRLTVKSGESISSRAAEAAVGAARQEVERLSGENAALLAKTASVEAERDELQAKVAELEAALAAAPKAETKTQAVAEDGERPASEAKPAAEVQPETKAKPERSGKR